MADGGNVAEWRNLGTWGGSASNATQAEQPGFDLRAVNGQPAVVGDGVDDSLNMDCTAHTVSDDMAMVMIYADLAVDEIIGHYFGGTDKMLILYDKRLRYGDETGYTPPDGGMADSGMLVLQHRYGQYGDNGIWKSRSARGTFGTGTAAEFRIGASFYPTATKLCAILMRSTSFSAPELNEIAQWARRTWGLDEIKPTWQPWTPSLLDPEAEWDPMRSLHDLDPGDSVSSLPDLTGNGHDAEQATSSKQPAVELGNGRKGIAADDVDDIMGDGQDNALGTNDLTVVSMFSLGGDLSSNDSRGIVAHRDTTNDGYWMFYFYENTLRMQFFSSSEGMMVVDIPDSKDYDRHIFVGRVIRDDAVRCRYDGADSGTPASFGSADTTDYGANGSFSLCGQFANLNWSMGGRLEYAAIIYRSLVEGEYRKLEEYLARRGAVILA